MALSPVYSLRSLPRKRIRLPCASSSYGTKLGKCMPPVNIIRLTNNFARTKHISPTNESRSSIFTEERLSSNDSCIRLLRRALSPLNPKVKRYVLNSRSAYFCYRSCPCSNLAVMFVSRPCTYYSSLDFPDHVFI